jgi:outer membrane protein OmpA-like peptidoglycan-associated protein
VRVALPAVVWLALASAACGHGGVVRGRVQGLESIVDTAEKNGAKQCAPRELALARAHLHFAATDLEQGELSNAEAHLLIAEPNAEAALKNSPAQRCGEAHAEPLPGDRDGDGYADAADKCPEEPETWNAYKDEDGCPDDPDTDGDKVPDSRDQCPAESEDFDGYLDDDGCPEPDNDVDGVPDAADKCPNIPEDLDGFEDTDGCPDPDNDKDSVPDVDDFCPNVPGQPGGPRSGCPGLVVVTAREIRIKEQIHFETNKAVIKADSFPILDAVRDVLRDNPKIKLEIQGHTDNVGNGPYNMKLSQARADSVRQYIVTHGIEAGRLISKGYGMTQPLVPNSSEGNRALNRRVQFIRTEASP